MKKIIEKVDLFFCHLEETPISFGLWIATFFGIVVVRDFLESALSFQSVSLMNAFHLLHFPIFFLSLFLSIILLLHFFSRECVLKISRMAIFFFPVILLPIFVDFLLQCVRPQSVLYVYVEKDLWWHFLNFFYFLVDNPSIPYGIRTEIAFIIITSFIYIYVKKKNCLRAALGSFCIYCACFLAISLPAIIGKIHGVLAFHVPALNLGNVTMLLNSIHSDMALRLVSITQLIFLSLFLGIWYWRYDAQKFQALLLNIRITRCVHYFLLMIFGLLVHRFFYIDTQINTSIIRLSGAFLSLFFAFQFSIVTNDIIDIKIDRISNRDRPLVRQIFSLSEYWVISFVYFSLSLLFAFQTSDAVFMLVIVFIVFYFLYSIPPLHLKRFLFGSCIVIGAEALIAVLIGYVLRQSNPVTLHVPFPEIFFGIFLVFFLSSSVKDLKDVSGDQNVGIMTLPILFGKDKANHVVGILALLGYVLLPISLYRVFSILTFVFVLVTSLFVGGVNFFYMKKGKVEEDAIFVLYFIYFIFICVALGIEGKLVHAQLTIGF